MAFIPMNSGKGLSTCTVVGTLSVTAATNALIDGTQKDFKTSTHTSTTTISINLKTKTYSISGNSIGRFHAAGMSRASNARGGANGSFTINSVTIV